MIDQSQTSDRGDQTLQPGINVNVLQRRSSGASAVNIQQISYHFIPQDAFIRKVVLLSKPWLSFVIGIDSHDLSNHGSYTARDQEVYGRI